MKEPFGPDPIQPTTEELVNEMQAIIHLAETTTSPAIKNACKAKLKQLSQIPLHNQWGIETISNYNYDYRVSN